MTMRTRRGVAPPVFGVAVVILLTGCGADPGEPENGAPAAGSAGTTAAGPPWPAPVDDVPALVEQAGLDLGPMGTAEHYHPALRLVVQGEEVAIPPNIGVDVTTGAMSAVHTHEGDGTIHVEADTVGETFTLGQLFTQWGVSLGEDHVGGVKATNAVSVTSNGQRFEGDPAQLRLRPDQEIVLKIE